MESIDSSFSDLSKLTEDLSAYVAIDFETYYDDEYSLTKMSMWNYVFHEKFSAYLLAIYGNGLEYVGSPKKFDWSKLCGKILVAHNAGFESLVLRRLSIDKAIPKFAAKLLLVDSADLAAYNLSPRSLDKAANLLANIQVSKSMRKKMAGVTWREARDRGWAEDMQKYGSGDAVASFSLWTKLSPDWPIKEQKISVLNRESCDYGVAIDKERLDLALYGDKKKEIKGVESLTIDALRALPWTNDGEKPLSMRSIAEQGRKDGIPVPGSLDKRSPDAIIWIQTYADKFAWVKAIGEYRQLNSLLQKLRTIQSNLRPDGTIPTSILYFGSHTGRFSGKTEDSGGKFNPQNMYRDPLYGVDVRGLIIPRPGKKLICIDYDQIQARLLLWRVGDTAMLPSLMQGEDIYEVYARLYLGYSDTGKLSDINPELRRLAKAAVLGCGFQCWWPKLKVTAKALVGLDLTDASAEAMVRGYREHNQKIVSYWYKHNDWVHFSANHGDKEHAFEMPSGRWLRYFNPRKEMVTCQGDQGKIYTRYDVTAEHIIGGARQRLYGGKLTENEMQGLERDVLCDAMLALANAGWRINSKRTVLFNTHDSLTCEAPLETAEEDFEFLKNVACRSSSWLEGCPVSVSGGIYDQYS
jgi:hypothetical protein